MTKPRKNPLDLKKLNSLFLKYVEGKDRDFRSDFSKFVLSWFDDNVLYADREYYPAGSEKTFMSDAYEEFIYVKQDDQWRSDMGINDLTMDDL